MSNPLQPHISLVEFEARREAVLSQIQANSIVIVSAAQEATRSNDTEYHFRQNSDFYYLTGFNEPDAFLVLSNKNNEQTDSVRSAIFVRPTDDFAEVWHGRRLGVDAAPQTLLVDIAYSIDDIEEILPELINGHDNLYFDLDANEHADDIVQSAMRVCKHAPKQSKIAPSSIVDVSQIIHAMRLIKSPQEIAVMQHSADISCGAHKAAMKICQASMIEYQLEATILHHFAMQGARHAAYNTIVGGGENACILHYTENTEALNEGELVLIDAGSEYQGYAADITRTFPVNGRFTIVQAQIYNLVLTTQLACIEKLVPGATINEVMKIAVRLVTQGLIKLGILRGKLEKLIASDAHKAFFMHGLGHYLGLDVHDVGNYKEQGQDKPLEIGMVITVEPGIYISRKAKVPSQYKSIGVRIEDNIVITATGNEVLTASVPKTIVDIETLMAS